MRNPIVLLVTALLALLLAACASNPVIRADYDRAADFSRYRSYGFLSPLGTDKAGYRSLLTERLSRATRAQLDARGYVYAARDPDLLVNFAARLDERIEVMPAPPYYGYGGGYYRMWPGYGWGSDVYQYTEGTLNVDLIDARTRQVVWEGVSVGEVRSVTESTSQETIDRVVGEMFARYPFRAGSAAVAQ